MWTCARVRVLVCFFCRFVVTRELPVPVYLYCTVHLFFASLLLHCQCSIAVAVAIPCALSTFVCNVTVFEFSFFVVVYRYNVNTSLHHRHMLPSFNCCSVSQWFSSPLASWLLLLDCRHLAIRGTVLMQIIYESCCCSCVFVAIISHCMVIIMGIIILLVDRLMFSQIW